MRYLVVFKTVVVFLCLVAVAVVCVAEDKVNESMAKPDKVSSEAKAVADLSMAARLAEYGKRAENPFALLVAAQIVKATPVTEKDRPKTTEGESTASSSTQKTDKKMTADSLIADARRMAEEQNDEIAIAAIEKERKVLAQRGALGGAILHEDRVLPGTTNVHEVIFKGGELAAIGIIGDGDCDLDLHVFDENHNLIDRDTDNLDACYAEFAPIWTGPFIIKVVNYCDVYADYALLTN